MSKFEHFFVTGGYTTELVYKRGYNVLGSYADGPTNISKFFTENKTKDNKVFVDSGAYTIFKASMKNPNSDSKIKVDKYIEYINSTGNADIYAQLDTIPGTYGCDSKESSKLTFDNYKYMIERVNCPQKLIAVHHYGEPMSMLKDLIEYKYNSNYPTYMCLARSGITNKTLLKNYFDECFEIILNSPNKDIKVHALGISDLHILESYPFYSSDSSTHLQMAVRGIIMIPHMDNGARNAIIISDIADVNNSNHYTKLTSNALSIVKGFIKDKGYEWEKLQTDVQLRAMYNSDFMMDLFDNYNCNYKRNYNKPLFDCNEFEDSNDINEFNFDNFKPLNQNINKEDVADTIFEESNILPDANVKEFEELLDKTDIDTNIKEYEKGLGVLIKQLVEVEVSDINNKLFNNEIYKQLDMLSNSIDILIEYSNKLKNQLEELKNKLDIINK